MNAFYTYENPKNICDSMQFSSGTFISELRCDDEKTLCIGASIIVHGSVNISFDDVDYDNPYFFPDELKQLIATDKDWMQNDRVYVCKNNWFELTVFRGIYSKYEHVCDEEVEIDSDVIDIDHNTNEEIYALMADAVNKHFPDTFPATLAEFAVTATIDTAT